MAFSTSSKPSISPSSVEQGAGALYRSLKSIGISRASVKAVLPFWWDESLAAEPSGMAELKVLLARRLSLDPSTLFDESKQVDFLPIVRRYKGGREELMQKLSASTAIASSLCRTALLFGQGSQNPSFPSDPEKLRRAILETGAPYVGLKELLTVCWNAGIPVLHVTLPKGVSKFDALVTSDGSRPAIALCRNEDSEAWMAFHLAHEIGHIARGHLGVDGMLVDEKIDSSSRTAQQELEANEYAEVLLGSVNVVAPHLSFKNLGQVAREFLKVAQETKVLPGHLVLKAGSCASDFRCARAVLAMVEGMSSARTVITEKASAELSKQNWTDEAEEFISQFFYTPGG